LFGLGGGLQISDKKDPWKIPKKNKDYQVFSYSLHNSLNFLRKHIQENPNETIKCIYKLELSSYIPLPKKNKTKKSFSNYKYFYEGFSSNGLVKLLSSFFIRPELSM
jgi:hypothetical protein